MFLISVQSDKWSKMNDLNRQLAELNLITNMEIQSASVNSQGKKIAPAVPPKPKKNQPQVNISYH